MLARRAHKNYYTWTLGAVLVACAQWEINQTPFLKERTSKRYPAPIKYSVAGQRGSAAAGARSPLPISCSKLLGDMHTSKPIEIVGVSRSYGYASTQILPTQPKGTLAWLTTDRPCHLSGVIPTHRRPQVQPMNDVVVAKLVAADVFAKNRFNPLRGERPDSQDSRDFTAPL